ncbi:hypothetical protein KL86DPRO_20500 [uncultured delta proteobacterium]|uniref:Uncharacterized protein n=1 Tax=uncultured delta proteobacterium TaxID=34034 RepID=A0A212K1J9_9DELT|nr:hypothetical protein KL86DPRO_20500 [uncultured delta proteobacterium]
MGTPTAGRWRVAPSPRPLEGKGDPAFALNTRQGVNKQPRRAGWEGAHQRGVKPWQKLFIAALLWMPCR